MSTRKLSQRAVEAAFTPTGPTFLVYFRILFGLLNIVLVWLYYDLGMIEEYYVVPEWHFSYYGFGWVQPWPGNGMYWHYAALALLSFLVTVGLFYRYAIVLLFLGLTHLFLIEQARYLNHYYLNILVALILIFLPAHRAFSLDALWRVKLRATTTPAWTLWILQFQVGIAYFFAGVAKLNWDWLTGVVLKPTLGDSTDVPLIALIGVVLDENSVALFVSWVGLLLDLFVVPLLLWKKTRWLALSATLVFHVTNSMLFSIDIFPWFMIGATYVLFFPDWLPFSKRITGGSTAEPDARSIWVRRLTIGTLAAYMVIHSLVPLRHHLYPGEPNWTEEGHHFAWRMLTRHKTGYVRQIAITYRDPGGRLVSAAVDLPKDPEFWTRHWRFQRMARTPDMILQFCHRQAELLREAGNTEIDIRADVVVSLNSRPYQQLIDPTVNLAAQPRTPFGRSEWILPLTTARPTLQELSRRPLEDGFALASTSLSNASARTR